MADSLEPDKHKPGPTQDEQLLESPGPAEFTHTDTWRVFLIMGEFVTGFDELATLSRGISVFGSARTHPDDPDYQAARETAGLLSRAGFAVITGGASGMGRASAQLFAKCGAKVVVADVDGPGADATVDLIRATEGEATAVRTPRRLEVVVRARRQRDRLATVGRDLPDVTPHRKRNPLSVRTPRGIERAGRYGRKHVSFFAIRMPVAIWARDEHGGRCRERGENYA